MLALFRNNRTTTAVVLLLYVIFTRLPALPGYVHPDLKEVAPGGMLWQTLFGWLEGDGKQLWSVSIAVLLVFIQTVWINHLANANRITDNRTWYPGVVYVLLTAFLPEFLYTSPTLVAVTFIPIALHYIFKSYKLPEVRYSVLDAALWITTGSLFYPPMFSLLLAGFIGLLIVRSFKTKERFVYVTGVFIPFFLAWLGHYWINKGTIFWHTQVQAFTGWYHFSPNWQGNTFVALTLIGSLMLMAIAGYSYFTERKLIQIRSYVQVLYVFLVIAGISVLLQGNFYNTYLLLFMPPAAILLSMAMLNVRRTSFLEIAHIILLVIAFSTQVYTG